MSDSSLDVQAKGIQFVQSAALALQFRAAEPVVQSTNGRKMNNAQTFLHHIQACQ